jgi:hypothetical protein
MKSMGRGCLRSGLAHGIVMTLRDVAMPHANEAEYSLKHPMAAPYRQYVYLQHAHGHRPHVRAGPQLPGVRRNRSRVGGGSAIGSTAPERPASVRHVFGNGTGARSMNCRDVRGGHCSICTELLLGIDL